MFVSPRETIAQVEEVISVPNLDAQFCVVNALASPGFKAQKWASDFLWFVCSKTLRGESDALTSRAVAAEVLSYPKELGTAADEIAEGLAEAAQELLECYYDEDGCDDGTRIFFEPNCFVPKFLSSDAYRDAVRTRNNWMADKIYSRLLQQAALQSPVYDEVAVA